MKENLYCIQAVTEYFSLFFVWVESTELATGLRFSHWTYAVLNASHILGISILIGGVLPLNLRLLGIWSNIPLTTVTRILVPMAGSGLTIAIFTGTILFSTRATEYSILPIFLFKLLFVSLGAISAIIMHITHGWWLHTATKPHMRLAALISLSCWFIVLLSGRLIGFF